MAAKVPNKTFVRIIFLRAALADAARIYFMIALAGILALCFLTPPFQVPDEQQHFYRAYQLSELHAIGRVSVNDHSDSNYAASIAGADLPSSLPEMVDRFLPSRAVHPDRTPKASPLRVSMESASIPLDPDRREFVGFSGSAFYSPLPYIPQTLAIMLGRTAGMGPLTLLYAARLANGLASATIFMLAIRLIPGGRVPLLVVGLLPMTLYEFASVSPDGLIISTTALFVALSLSAWTHRRWTLCTASGAFLAGAVFCSVKPVYAPLLLVSLPMIFSRQGGLSAAAWLAAICSFVLGVTGLWLLFVHSTLVTAHEGVNLEQQAAFLRDAPTRMIGLTLNTLREYSADWLKGAVGTLGWLSLPLTGGMYALVAVAAVASFTTEPQSHVRFGAGGAVWCVGVAFACTSLVFLALYLYWTAVGYPTVEGVQGRYFLPIWVLLAPMVAMALPRFSAGIMGASRGTAYYLMASVTVLTCLLVARAYEVFS